MKRIWQKHYGDMSPEIRWEQDGSMADLIERAAEKFADLPAVACFGTTLSYRQVERLSRDFAAYLQNGLGLEQGARVAIMLPNIIPFHVASFGMIRAGMVQVNVNPMYTPHELAHQLNDSGAETIVVASMVSATLGAVLEQTQIKTVITVDLADLTAAPIPAAPVDEAITGAIALTDALAQGAQLAFKRPEITQDDLIFLQYTGGTTGLSKGAMLSHGNLVSNVAVYDALAGAITEEGKEIVITPIPMYHIFALMVNCLCYWRYGALNVLIADPRDMAGFVKTLSQYKFTAMTGVNTLYNGLLHTPGFAELDFSSLKVCWGGGAPIQEAVSHKWHDITGGHIREGYGLSETSPIVSMNLVARNAYTGTIGIPVPSTDISLRDENGVEVEIGAEGELCVRGPQVMQGYWNRPDATAEVMTEDGYFCTGDVAVADADGFFRIVDRKKDMILVSGFNVYPNEIEGAVALIPGIVECACIGVPDDHTGEAVKVFAVRYDDTLTEAMVRSTCRETLTGYKVPATVEFIDELPKSSVGKILRRALRRV